MDEETNNQASGSPEEVAPTPKANKSVRWLVGGLTAALLLIVAGGLFWMFALSSESPVGVGWYVFSFTAGLSMIILPCTLPLAFVIVPLVMGKGYAKGLAIALSFSIGVAITLSMYGILAALLGKAVFAFSGGEGEIIKNIFYALAGVFAIVFALGELGFFKVRMPTYGGAVPGFIQNRTDLLRPLLMGLFLGNIGVGCPHPATPIILGQIGVVGDVFYGWLLFFVHAIGRVLPLLVLAMFGIIGINATKSLVRHRASIAKATGWSMVFVGAFLFTLGFFGHDWWIASGQHALFEDVVQEQRFTEVLRDRFDSTVTHIHEVPEGTGFFGLPLWLGNWALVLLIVGPIWWYWRGERKRVKELPENIRGPPKSLLRWKTWTFLLLTFILGILLIYILPHRFLVHQQISHEDDRADMVVEEIIPHDDEGTMPHGH